MRRFGISTLALLAAVLFNHHARKRIVRVARTFAIAGHDSEPAPEFVPPPRKFELIIWSHEAAVSRAGSLCLHNGSEAVPTCRTPPLPSTVLVRAAYPARAQRALRRHTDT
ncbi:hypothetical protein HYPSUDRAFT_64213 [Hypholoma sublateritium FD-334 SS-4]|uniref:Secreted protein n=1 Tax=Hypholoma sublateritium (strain FD-334 SS-4) TaxID=945553 RepID=A0A0D2MPT7_HYPSF|nr:hypothetical protein HYPSUDRAFT_64213 [Hypholoma sublateritium FD-334 SS-4]